MFKVDESLFEKVVEKFNRNKQSADEDVATIQKWINAQPHLLEPLDRRSILNFLILNKFSIEKTKQKIDNYYTVRTKLDDIYAHIHPKFSNMQEIKQIMYFVPHPQLLNYSRVLFLKVRNVDLVEKLDPYNMLRYTTSLLEIRMREDVMYKEISVIDCKNIPLSFFLKLTPTFLFKSVGLISRDIYSSRLKVCYLVNFPAFGETLGKLLKKVMKAKIFERVHFFSDDGILKEKFSENFLPEDFGGKGMCLEKLQEMLDAELEKHQELFDHLEKFKFDESRRPIKLENNEMLGFYGNFKKLNLD